MHKLKYANYDERPSTADGSSSSTADPLAGSVDGFYLRQAAAAGTAVGARPTTAAVGRRVGGESPPPARQIVRPATQVPSPRRSKVDGFAAAEIARAGPVGPVGPGRGGLQAAVEPLTCQRVTIYILSTWGDMHYTGLCGLQLLVDKACTVTDLSPSQVTTTPKDLSTLGFFDDPRIPDNLVNGYNNTSDDKHMWLTPFTPGKGSKHSIEINLQRKTKLAGLRIW